MNRCRDCARKLANRRLQRAAIAEQDAEVFEVLIGQMS
jgi:hypothetical protein